MYEINQKKKGSLTKLDKERNSKIEKGEALEILEAVGSENEKEGIRATIEFQTESQKRNQEKEDRLKDYLQDKSKSITYDSLLRNLLDALCSQVELPEGYDYRVTSDERGIALIIKTPGGLYAKGFKPCQDGKYDLNACRTIRDNLENTIERVSNSKNS